MSRCSSSTRNVSTAIICTCKTSQGSNDHQAPSIQQRRRPTSIPSAAPWWHRQRDGWVNLGCEDDKACGKRPSRHIASMSTSTWKGRLEMLQSYGLLHISRTSFGIFDPVHVRSPCHLWVFQSHVLCRRPQGMSHLLYWDDGRRSFISSPDIP